MKKMLLGFSLLLVFLTATYAKPRYIGMQRAKAIALREVKGRIQSSEREKENGKMIYSFDIRTAKRGITEVNIDAVTGAVIAVKVETPADEAKEKADDKKSGKH